MSSSTASATKLFEEHDNKLLAYFSLHIQKNLKQKPVLPCEKCRKQIREKKVCGDVHFENYLDVPDGR